MAQQLPAFLTAQWRNLVMLNYQIDPAIVKGLLPAGTEIDFWNGRTYVSVVAFRFLDTKLRGLPIPFHRHFDEINLRFYVRRQVDKQWRRGVVFVKEVVPLRAVAYVARWVYNENYVALPMRHQLQIPQPENDFHGSFYYSWKWRHDWIELSARTQGEAQPLIAGSEAEFITEHYWGYTRQRDGGTIEYGVEHPSWRTWNTTSGKLTGDVAAFYGFEFGEVLSESPASIFVADGSPIVVRKGIRL